MGVSFSFSVARKVVFCAVSSNYVNTAAFTLSPLYCMQPADIGSSASVSL